MNLYDNNTENFLINPFKIIWLKIQYFFATLKDFYRYPYVLVGELPANNAKTILLYQLRGKRDVYQQSAQEICNNPELITKFHPMDVRIISYICGVEQIIELPAEYRVEKFADIKNRIFKK